MFIDRSSMYEKLRSLKGGIYIIDEIIGVGKTTLGTSLENYLNDIGLKCKLYKEYYNEDLLEILESMLIFSNDYGCKKNRNI